MLSQRTSCPILTGVLFLAGCLSEGLFGAPDLIVDWAAVKEVPPEKRERLLQRLSLAVQATAEQDFEALYDFLPEPCRGGLTKEQWCSQVRYAGPGRLEKFLVTSVYRGGWGNDSYNSPKDEDWWVIRGCATYTTASGSARYDASFSALLQNDGWYFCAIGHAIEGEERNPIECSRE